MTRWLKHWLHSCLLASCLSVLWFCAAEKGQQGLFCRYSVPDALWLSFLLTFRKHFSCSRGCIGGLSTAQVITSI